jgi:hypothetical protein
MPYKDLAVATRALLTEGDTDMPLQNRPALLVVGFVEAARFWGG